METKKGFHLNLINSTSLKQSTKENKKKGIFVR